MSEDTEFGHDLIASMEEAAAILRGAVNASRVHLAQGTPDIRAIREHLGLGIAEFAARFGLSVGDIRGWEQGIRRPDEAASILLRVIARNPDLVAEVAAEPHAA